MGRVVIQCVVPDVECAVLECKTCGGKRDPVSDERDVRRFDGILSHSQIAIDLHAVNYIK